MSASAWFCTGCGRKVAAVPSPDPRYAIASCSDCKGKRPAVQDHATAIRLASEAAAAAAARKAARK